MPASMKEEARKMMPSHDDDFDTDIIGYRTRRRRLIFKDYGPRQHADTTISVTPRHHR